MARNPLGCSAARAQVNGKVRGEVQAAPDASEDDVKALALANDKVRRAARRRVFLFGGSRVCVRRFSFLLFRRRPHRFAVALFGSHAPRERRPAQIASLVDGKDLKKFVYVPGRIVNFVVGK